MIRKISLLIILFAFIPVYFWGHNSGQSAFNFANGFITIARFSVDLLITIITVSIAGGIGRYSIQRGLDSKSPHGISQSEAIALEAGIGFGVIGMGVLIFGLIGYFNGIMWITLLIGSLFIIRSIFGWFNDCRHVLIRAMQPGTPWERIIVGYAGFLLILALLIALAPPTSWDAMTYHLEGSSRYIQTGKITAYADNHYLGFPQTIEMVYGLAMLSFGSDSIPALLHFTIGLLALMATAGLTRRHSDTTTGYTSILLLMSSYSIWMLFGWPYIDLAMLLYGALALVTVTKWNEAKQPKWLILTAIVASIAFGVKYTGASIIIALAIFIMLRQPKRIEITGLLFGGVSLIVFLPWLIKGFLLYENPIYPYVFDGLYWDHLRSENFGVTYNTLLGGDLWWHWPLLPLTATIFGIHNVSPYNFTLGAWLLTLPFTLVYGWNVLNEKARQLARDLIPIGVVLLAFWMAMAAQSGIGPQPRLMLVGLPTAAILGALALRGIARLPRKPLNIYFIVQAIIIFTLLINLFDVMHSFASKRVLEVYTGDISRDDYIATNLGIVYPALRHLETLPENSTVQVMWEAKTYYCPETITCIADNLYDHWWRPLKLGTNPDDLMQQWREEGVDYLLVYGLQTDYNVGYDFWLGVHLSAYEENSLFPEYLNTYMEPIWDDGIAFTLYTWKE